MRMTGFWDNLHQVRLNLTECKKGFNILKGVIRIRDSKRDRQYNGQKEKGQKKQKQQSTKHYIEN